MLGFLNINKPSGLTSSKVVALVKRLCPRGTKVGHMGTLDPMASGVLPIAIGRATRLFDLMQDKQKEYVATFKFGLTTDTLDATGITTDTTKNIPTEQQIVNKLSSFVGEIEQMPPAYSAKMVGGVRAYEKARKGQEVLLKPCKVKIFKFELLEKIDQSTYKFKIQCGSGTYIRSLCRDLAAQLNSLAVMTELVRTKTGPFCLENSLSCDNINLSSIMLVDQVLNYPKLSLSEVELKVLLDGKQIKKNCLDGAYLGYVGNELQLVLTMKNGCSTTKIWLR